MPPSGSPHPDPPPEGGRRLGAAAALAAALLLTGCHGVPPNEERLPVELVAAEAQAPGATPLSPEEIAERMQRAVVEIEVPPRGTKPFGEYLRDVGAAFVNLIPQPLTAPVAIFEVFFGWIDLYRSYGTGFTVTARGHVVTNFHVVEDAEEVAYERPDGSKGRARVVARDKGRDLALLRLELPARTSLTPQEVAPLGPSSVVRLGQRIVLFGFPGRPWNQEGAPKPTITHGIVSSLDIDVGEAANRFQVDAAANAGSSGGPMLDDRGRIVGVVTEAADPGSFSGQTFTIPSDDVIKAFFKPPPENGPGK
jgi:S1-C subfamily serine protease